MRKLQGNHFDCIKLIEDHANEMVVRLSPLPEGTEPAGMQNQFPQ